MTTQTPTKPIHLDGDGYHRVTDAALARMLYTDPAVTTRDALRPMEPLLPPADGIYRQVLASPAAARAQRSLLAADGELHTRLGKPVEAALLRMYQRPDFIADVEAEAQLLADDLESRAREVDLAKDMHRVPAKVAVDILFGMVAPPSDVRQWARRQTDFIWRRRQPSETDTQVAQWQVDGLMAARDLTIACAETVAWHKSDAAAGGRIDDVTSDLLDVPGLSEDEVMGLVYGVGIAAIEGNGFSIGNVIYGALVRGMWRALAEAPDWRAAYTMISPLLKARPGIHTTYRTTDAAFYFEDGYVIPRGATIAFDLLAIGDPFGGIGNPHHCVGAGIGRVSVAVVPWVLARRFPKAALVEDQPLDSVASRFFLGFKHLWVLRSPGGAR
jgi:cytochrome P450